MAHRSIGVSPDGEGGNRAWPHAYPQSPTTNPLVLNTKRRLQSRRRDSSEGFLRQCAAHAAGVSDNHAALLANHAVPKSDVHGGYVLPDPEALRPSQQRVTDYLRRHTLPL
jgi:hypothetical protein